MINFPSNPTTNQQYTFNTRTWQWNGTTWESVGNLSNIVVNVDVSAKANIIDLTTANVAEITNLYYTNVRVLTTVTKNTLSNITTGNISVVGNDYEGLDVNSTYGGINITNSRGQFTIGNNTRDGVARFTLNTASNIYAGVQVQRAGVEKWFIGANQSENFVIRGNIAGTYTDVFTINTNGNIILTGYATTSNVNLKANTTDLTTANVAEVTNQYFTNTRAYANVILMGLATTANLALKANIADLKTANIAEVTNLYFTNARVYSNVTQLGYYSNTTTITNNNTITANAATAFIAGDNAISGVALQLPSEGALRNLTNGLTNMYFDVSIGGTTQGQFQFRSSSAYTNILTMSPTAFNVNIGATVTARTPSLARTAFNSAIDTEITVDEMRFRISNQAGIFPQVIGNSSSRNLAWTGVGACSGAAVTQVGSTGTIVASNAWTTLYNAHGMDSPGDTITVTLQDKAAGRIYRITFMRSDNGSTTGYNIVAERLL